MSLNQLKTTNNDNDNDMSMSIDEPIYSNKYCFDLRQGNNNISEFDVDIVKINNNKKNKDQTVIREKSAMNSAIDIVNRIRARGGEMPKYRDTDEQQLKDYRKLSSWKHHVSHPNVNSTYIIHQRVIDYLDNEIVGWRDTTIDKAMYDAINIVKRTKELRNGKIAIIYKNNENIDEWYLRDAHRIAGWKCALTGTGHSKCPDSVKEYMDKELPNWRDNKKKKIMDNVVTIVNHIKNNNNIINKEDRQKLNYWKKYLKHNDCVFDFLDNELPGWR
jgi:hypothetical protein